MVETRRVRRERVVLASLGFLAVLGCGGSQRPAEDGDGTDAGPPAGTRVLVDGLNGPTQLAEGPDGRLLVAQLNGPEGQPTGQVLYVDTTSGERRVLLDGLDTPTGVLWLHDRLWVMERRSLISAYWDGRGQPSDRQVVLEDLPFNGRSEGTLTGLGDGRILYETSGAIRNGEVVEASGALWLLDPETGTSQRFATGLKNAYAHAVLADGSVLSTEIGDNIADPPEDELQLFTDASGGATPDGGWPGCPPPQSCPGVTGPLATFPAGATPTGVAVLGDRAVVALFVEGSLVEVDFSGWMPGDDPRRPTTLAEGLDGPHSVLSRNDGSLWVSEHGAGRVLAVDE